MGLESYRPNRGVIIHRHHILNNRVEWTARSLALNLRENKSLIPSIEQSLHVELHRVTPPVPLLGYHALLGVTRLYEPGDSTLGSFDNLMSAIEESSKHPKAHPIERDLARLAVRAIELQRNFWRENVK